MLKWYLLIVMTTGNDGDVAIKEIGPFPLVTHCTQVADAVKKMQLVNSRASTTHAQYKDVVCYQREAKLND